MPTIILTDLAIRALKPPGRGQIDYWDTKTPSFGVRVSQGGTKTFIAKRANRRHSLGRFPAISLQGARTAAKRLLADTYAIATPEITFSDALDRFVTTHCEQKNKPRTAKETERILRHDFLPRWRASPVGAITKHDLTCILDRMLDRPGAANHAFTAIRTFFNWCVRRDYIPHSPCAGLGLPAKKIARSRVLSDPELVCVWRAAVHAGYPYGTIVQLLILTGQRRGEIAAIDRSFINGKDRTITFPAELVKNGREHTVPYGQMVADILETIPRLNSTNLLFPARGYDDRPFCGFNKGKAALEWHPTIKPWTLHDLRRTLATNMAALGVAPHVVERLLNHASGTISGVAAIYNRYSFQPEMRDAMTKWEARLTTLLSETGDLQLDNAA